MLGCLLLMEVFIISCQQEIGFEEISGPARGTITKDQNNTCLPAEFTGLYSAGMNLQPAIHTLVVDVTIISPGSYIITSDTVNGVFFSGKGYFSVAGSQKVILQGSGRINNTDPLELIVRFDQSDCTVTINQGNGSGGTTQFTLVASGSPLTCGTPTINGSYEENQALTVLNTVRLNVNVLVAGSYDITTAVVNGMTFSGAGMLNVGPHSIILTGSGTPLNAGPTAINISSGSSACLFTILVSDTNAGNEWECSITNPVKFLEGETESAILTPLAGLMAFTYSGFNSSDDIKFTLRDASGTLQPGEEYTTKGDLPNTASFTYLVNAGIDILNTDDNHVIQITILSHIPLQKLMTGTFSGSVRNTAGATRFISNGIFKASYD